MTREEAIKQIEALRTCMIVDDAEPYVVEALNMAVEALEQEPKTGHWIRQDNTKKPLYGWYFCSECNSVIGDKTKFCSNCGAKMGDKE